ncbi:uncharacterized protein LOC129303006 [Prosopis cineraria]|uniref:uncharacterized protein LOC129303006 n=1 Tax=Prosopis cineraria TaxID=364024 RepID=UPI00240F3033|nr:uncharacterized protein LOC129303006 [Prosopis cineraria]
MYSISKMKSDRKPPLAKSPMRLRPRRVLRPSNSCSLQTPSGSLTESKNPTGCLNIEESELRPEYRTISCELRALMKMVREEFGKRDSENIESANSFGVNSGILFERGRFYDEYSARRNERLKRRKTGDYGKAPAYNLGVAVESAKKSSSKKLESLRKSVSATYTMERLEAPRYMLRSMTKGNKKLPPLPSNLEKSTTGVDKKTGASRLRRT